MNLDVFLAGLWMQVFNFQSGKIVPLPLGPKPRFKKIYFPALSQCCRDTPRILLYHSITKVVMREGSASVDCRACHQLIR